MKKLISKDTVILLNLLRFISCLIVVSGHYFQIFLNRLFDIDSIINEKPFLSLIFHLPTLGVMIFFVLSGFLITYSSMIDIDKRGNFSLINYVKKRCFRIFPPLWFSMILSFFIFLSIKYLNLFGAESYLLPGDLYTVREKALMPIKEIVRNFFLIPGLTGGFNGALWSLSYEFFYYIIFAIFLLIKPSKNFKLAILSIVTIMIFITISIIINHDYLIAITKIFQLFLVWLMGSFVALLYLRGNIDSSTKDTYSLLAILFLGLFIVKINLFLSNEILEMIMYGLISSLIICYLLSLDYKPGNTISIFSNGSNYTYTLYLIHFPIFLLVLSLLNYRLLKFQIIDYINLYLLLLFTVNIFSYYTAKIFEDRKLMELYTISLFSKVKIWRIKNVFFQLR